MKVAIILPAYNEEITIQDTIWDFATHFPHATIVVANNNSKDKTKSIAEDAIKKANVQGFVLDEYRQGKGYAVRSAFASIDADIYVMVDADFTYPAKDLVTLIEPIKNRQADLVVGNRFFGGAYSRENKRLFHDFGNQLVKTLINRLFRSNLQDIMTGYRVMSKKFVRLYPLMSPGFELETEMTLHALDKRFVVKELPTEYRDRPQGSFSKLNTYRDGMRVIATIFNIFRFYRPLVFFSVLGLLFSAFSLAAGTPVLYEYFETHYITRIPLAVLATGLGLVALLLFTIGLILDSVNRMERR